MFFALCILPCTESVLRTSPQFDCGVFIILDFGCLHHIGTRCVICIFIVINVKFTFWSSHKLVFQNYRPRDKLRAVWIYNTLEVSGCWSEDWAWKIFMQKSKHPLRPFSRKENFFTFFGFRWCNHVVNRAVDEIVILDCVLFRRDPYQDLIFAIPLHHL